MATKKRARKAKSVSTESRRSEGDRPTWDGKIDNDELVRPGGALLAMLSGRARQLGQTRGELAKSLGVTYGYIAQLASGHRKPEQISEEFAGACARYLGVPKVTVLMAAGVLTEQDFFEQPDEIAAALPRIISVIREDREFAPIFPPELIKDVSPQLQFFVVRLFEKARGVKLIPGEHSIDSITASLKKIENLRKELRKAAQTHD